MGITFPEATKPSLRLALKSCAIATLASAFCGCDDKQDVAELQRQLGEEKRLRASEGGDLRQRLSELERRVAASDLVYGQMQSSVDSLLAEIASRRDAANDASKLLQGELDYINAELNRSAAEDAARKRGEMVRIELPTMCADGPWMKWPATLKEGPKTIHANQILVQNLDSLESELRKLQSPEAAK